MNTPTSETTDNKIYKMDSIHEYIKIIVKDLNELVKAYNITYTTTAEPYKNDYRIKISVENSASEIIKKGDLAISITSYITEENINIFIWKKKAHQIHLVIKTNMDKFPDLRIEAIRALFKLYAHKLLTHLKHTDIKDVHPRIDFLFT